MKIRLLNDGYFDFLKGLKFPAEVDAFAHPYLDYAVHVSCHELLRVGGDVSCRCSPFWCFTGDQYEAIE